MLNEDEKHKLLQGCKSFADRWPRAYSYHRMMTPKEHVLTRHIPHYVQHWGTIGLFGEDGSRIPSLQVCDIPTFGCFLAEYSRVHAVHALSLIHI